MSVWLRRDRLTNIALKLVRSMASLPASRTASACTWSKALATWPISSEVSTSIGATSSSVSGDSLSRFIRCGSCTVAMSSASARSRRSGTASDLATRSAAASTISSTTTTLTKMSSADCPAPCSSDSARATASCAIPCSTACVSSSFCEAAWYQDTGAWATLNPTVSVLMFELRNGSFRSAPPSIRK